MQIIRLRLALWASFCFVVALLPQGGSAQTTILRDDFNGTQVNTNVWEVRKTFSDSDVTVGGGNVVLLNRGKLVTRASFANNIEIRTRFAFTGNPNDVFDVWWRTDGDENPASGNNSREFVRGVRLHCQIIDVGLEWYDHPVNVGARVRFNANLVANTFYDVLVRDDGTNIQAWVGNTNGRPVLTLSITNRFGSKVGMYNREGAGNGSSISAGSESSVDFIEITSLGGNSTTGGKCLAAPQGLVSMWPFEGNVMDAIGTNHGTLVGSPTFAPGQVSQAIYVTNTVGFTNYVMVPAAPSLNVGAGPGMSIEGWITPTDLQTFQPLVEWNRDIPMGANTIGTQFWINGGNGGVVPGGGPGALYANLIDVNNISHELYSTPGVLTNNVFNHVAMTYDQASGLTKLFVNGVRVGQTNLGSFTPQTSYDLYFAKQTAANVPIVNQSFTGAMDELSLYNRALTDSEVQAIAQAGSQGKYQNCPTNSISIQPADLEVTAGATAVFSVEVIGSAPTGYQWTHGGFNIPGATGASLNITNASQADAGDYAVRVYFTAGAVLSQTAILTVVYPLPVVLVEPQDQQLHVGEDLVLRLDAAGAPPLSYLWRMNGANTQGGTNATLRLASVTTNEAGEYLAIVSNPAGVVFSRKAFVSVNPAPFVFQPPRNQHVALGSAATFAVQMLGQPPFSYQWLFNGVVLSGQTSATLTLTPVGATNEGRYSVAVTNAFGGVISSEAQLTVLRPAIGFGRTTNGSGGLAFSFPAEATGFILESSPTLGAGAVWTVVTNLATLPNGQITLPIDPAGGPRYFRLRTP